MVNVEDHELLLRCQCGGLDHVASLIHDPDTSRGNNLKGESDCWYLSVTLDHFGFWKRASMAFRYVFAPRSIRYGMTAELVLTNNDMNDVVNFIVRRQNEVQGANQSNSGPVA